MDTPGVSVAPSKDCRGRGFGGAFSLSAESFEDEGDPVGGGFDANDASRTSLSPASILDLGDLAVA